MKTTCALFTLALAVSRASAGYLDDYINAGPAFLDSVRLPAFDIVGNSTAGATAGRNWTGHCLNLTSQVWLTEDDWGADWGGAGARWWHYLYVIVPSVVADREADWRSLYITGGKNTDKPPTADDLDISATAQLAMATEQVWVTLFQVPNCKIYFRDEEGTPNNDENQLLAKTFVHVMDDAAGANLTLAQASRAILLPMTKAAFGAMAAADEFLAVTGAAGAAAGKGSRSDGAQTQWVVTGASKRGWTAWLVGAVDALRQSNTVKARQIEAAAATTASHAGGAPEGSSSSDGPASAAPTWPQRVVAIAPLVMDGLKFHDYLHLQFSALGGWSFAMEAFVEAGFTGRIDQPEFATLFDIIDPYAYKERCGALVV